MNGSLRELVLQEARLEASGIAAGAEEQAAALLEDARREAEERIRRARSLDGAGGTAESTRAVALARRRTRSRVLEARREAYEELGRRVRRAALGLRDGDGYDGLVARLSGEARERLGGDAVVVADPERGGLVGRSGRRRVDLTLTTLADRCLESLGSRVEELWR